MGGLPFTRAMSRDGRWAYTLYGGGEETFIHALDTEGRTAACIDLDMLPPAGDLSGVRLLVSPDGRRVDVRDGGSPVAVVDARTFRVSEPVAAAPKRRAAARSDDGGGLPWWAPALAAAAAAGLAVLALACARARRLGSRHDEHRDAATPGDLDPAALSPQRRPPDHRPGQEPA